MTGPARICLAAAAVVLTLSASTAAFATASSSYGVWTSGAPNDTTLPTPHKGFQLTTNKCVVCHAIHKAYADGEALLRTSVADACSYCHVETAIGNVRIYNGSTSAYTADIKQNHSRDGGAPCTGCHAVHGANTYEGPMAVKILKRLPIQPSFVRLFTDATNTPEPFYTGDFPYWAAGPGTAVLCSPPNQYEDWGGAWLVQQTAFCTGCHPYFTRASEDTITVDHMIVDGAISTATVSFKSHPMKRQWNFDASGNMWFGFEASGSTLPTSTRVAYMSTNGCFRCHGYADYVNLGPGLHESSYPHYTPYRERFLLSANEQGFKTLTTTDSSQDGTCFVCHRNGVQGVGLTY